MKAHLMKKIIHDELNLEGLKITNGSSYSSATTGFQSMTSKAPSSSLSSIVFDRQKAVKRKLDFDVNSSSDEDSSIRRENGKRRCLGGVPIRNPSFVESESTLRSPTKNRRSAPSYSRSSVSSSCRRRLFPYDRETVDRELRSPTHLPRTSSRHNEIVLSLKKKFPGVPNSDSARSGLLLNLAFSKYNLPNVDGSGQKSNVSYDFVDHASMGSTAKKACIQYTSTIEKDHSSLTKSPVFTAIRKVKRRLNLEEPDAEKSPNETSQIVPRAKTPQKNSITWKASADSTVANENLSRSFPPVLANVKKPQNHHKDLYKNSKLRPSLREKIFGLSVSNAADASDNITDVDVMGHNSTELAGSSSTWRAGRCDEESSSLKKCKPEYHRIVVREDLVERAKKDARRLKLMSSLGSETLNIQKISRRSSTGHSLRESSHENVPKHTCCPRKPHSSFIDEHIQRFLKDCSERTNLGLVSDEYDVHAEEIGRTQLPPESDGELSASFHVLDENEDVELARNSSGLLIEDANSHDADRSKNDSEFVIENINSPENNGKNTRILDDSMNDLEETGQKENISVISSSGKVDVEKQNVKIEDVLTQKDEPSIIVSTNFGRDDQMETTMQVDILDSAMKKYPLKKRHSLQLRSGTLSGRLQMVLRKEKSEARIWEYELSKKSATSGAENGSSNPNSPVMFCVKKMWKEFSQLVVLCARVDSDPSDEFFKNNLNDIGTDVPHSLVIVIKPKLFPKNISHNSIIRIQPPWRILYSAALNLHVLLQPTKVEVISSNSKPFSYSDPTSPLRPKTVEQNRFCNCHNECDCLLPNLYGSVMPTFLSLLSNSDQASSLKRYVPDDLQTITGIDDLIAMYRLLYAEFHVDLKVLSVDRDSEKAAFWHIIGLNSQAEKFCVLVKDEIEHLSSIRAGMEVRCTGVIPWKTVPSRLVPAFLDKLNLRENDLMSELDTHALHVFVLSARHGKIGPP